MTSVFPLFPTSMKCFLPPLSESILLGKGENDSFLRENEKKVNEEKPGAEARPWSVSQLLFLKPKM